ncbi:potassium channel family protein [Geosporobacter ferrireducens]|uniref:Potassium transporter Trk n=1 Tax=Geosporobacter ferrireducens TaxID=1424294 RepID=A0A1D8GDP5_9FIRM|nr:TrkA family potassium uptake protein [Geosporobacter ferrireducens]AOT69027.1 potassium transporter Trk [Geosporobacter ferrireducens]MTI56695.1 TrkA family potassium uptake protein [Geosporobacter ferrireducens]
MKQYVVIGCGRFGSSVARALYGMGYDVMAIDRDEDVVQDIADSVTHAVQADVTDEASIKALGIRNFDVAIIAIGSDIQSSILATLIVKELGVKYVVAKAQNQLHGNVLAKTGADRIVYPERDMGVRVAHNLGSSNILDYIDLSPEYSILEINALTEWEGKSLETLNIRGKYGINVMAIKQGTEINITPSPTDKIKKNDVMVVIGHNKDLQKLAERS